LLFYRVSVKSLSANGSAEDQSHYQVSGFQPIQVMQAIMTPEQFIGFNLGNVLKYAMRLNHKNQSRLDAGKCQQYATWMCEAMDGKIIVPPVAKGEINS